MSKPCICCKQQKPIDEFYRHPQMGDGRLNKCKDCCRKHARENRQDNLEAKRAYDRERFRRPERKAKVSKYQRAMRARHPKKYAARTAVGNAIRDGRLTKKPCQVCGTAHDVQAHHTDYSKPLDVQWLCRQHHWDAHHPERIAS